MTDGRDNTHIAPIMDIVLKRRDMEHRMARFYCMAVQARLSFEAHETWDLVREWGRIGSPGTVRADSFAGLAEAQAAAQALRARKCRRGYR